MMGKASDLATILQPVSFLDVDGSSSADFSTIAAFNKAAGDPLRLEILRVLACDAYGVLELSQIFDHRQSGMSHHLKVLAEAGLVAKRREGNSIFYSRALSASDDAWQGLQQTLYRAIDDLPLTKSVLKQVELIKADRAEQSRIFFEENAEKFKEQQDLIADFPTYGAAVEELLQKTATPSRKTALEIGPGEGEFLPVLAKHFEQVTALDNAPAMLEYSQRYCMQQGIHNIQFVNQDTRWLQQQPMQETIDCVVMNMVLHHTPSPADIFQDIAQSLKMNGVLIVTELCRHDQDWAKTACGDQWLGFDTSELQHWAQAAGLAYGHSHYFALRNGFQIQLQQYVKTAVT